jgi:hypothetical protein
MAKQRKRPAQKRQTFLDILMNAIAEAMKNENLKFTNDDKIKCRCILIALAHRITHEEFKMVKHWPEIS